jgi:hypothetical protein
MYAKCGDIDHARSVFGLIVDKDSVSWNSMITGLDLLVLIDSIFGLIVGSSCRALFMYG